MRLVRCEQCGKELREGFSRRFEVSMPDFIRTGDKPETDFCSERCIVLYYAKKAGMTVLGEDNKKEEPEESGTTRS